MTAPPSTQPAARPVHVPSTRQRRRNRLMGLGLAVIVLAIYVWVFVRGSDFMGG